METIYERLVTKGRGWEILQPPQTKLGEKPPTRPPKTNEVEISYEDAIKFDRSLRNLSRRSQSEYTERGVRVLFITFGTLTWTEKTTGTEVISPLLLTPVELTKEKPRQPYTLKVPPVEDITLRNPALALKLKYEHGIELPDLPEDDEVTPSAYLETVQKKVEELGWKVSPTVDLGLFSFSKIAIYQDLNDNVNRIVEHPLARALAGERIENLVKNGLPTVEELDNILDPETSHQILDADSSQQLCIQYALRGQSFVMHGPPGTGKSQTIANIISEYIAAGKSVLFISEKMAALEVVYNRLKEKDLDEYCLELHSYKANKREVIQELSRCLTEHLKTGKGMTSSEIELLRHRRSQLNEYVESLHKPRKPLNKSAYELLDEVAKLTSIPSTTATITNIFTVTPEKKTLHEEQITHLRDAWDVIEEGASFPWRGCKTQSYTLTTREEWASLLHSLIESAKQLRLNAYNYSEKLRITLPEHLEDYDKIQKIANIVEATPYPPIEWLKEADLDKIQLEADTHRVEWNEYWTTRNELDRKYDARFRALPSSKSDEAQKNWDEARQLLKPGQSEDGGLLRDFEDLEAFLEQTQRDSTLWEEKIDSINKILGLTPEPDTVNVVRKTFRVAQLCETPHRPLRSWLDRYVLDEAEKTLEETEILYKRRDTLRGSLKDYNEEFLHLDHKTLINYLEGPGSGILRYLRPRYYSVRSEISRCTLRGEVPGTITQDLANASELKTLLGIIETQRKEAESKLGVYYHDKDPDFQAAHEGQRVAREVLNLIGTQKAPKLLRDNLCVATKPKEELISSTKSLGESLTSWIKKSKQLSTLIPDRQAGANTRLLDMPLVELRNWAADLADRLRRLRETIHPATITIVSDPPKTLTRLIADLRKARALHDFEYGEVEKSPQLTTRFGRLYKGVTTDWSKIIEAISWTKMLLKTLPTQPSAELLSYVTDHTLDRVKLDDGKLLVDTYRYLEELNSRFTAPLWSTPPQSLTIDEILTIASRLDQRLDDLQTWVDFNTASTQLQETGLGDLLSEMVEKKYKRNHLLDIYRKTLFTSLLSAISAEDSTLASFRGARQNEIISEFRKLDSALIREAPSKVIQSANAKKPQGVFVEAQDSEISILLKEVSKKRRQMPLRHLFNRIPTLIRRLKPCFLMSPLSVSQFILPNKMHFDLVIFDEASQIYTEDAIGSIYRGDALVVAGDNRQLPPTPFFQYVADSEAEWEDEASNEIGAYDSVLDECMGMGLPVSMLRWHYRSKHDQLIAFSNRHFYDEKLILFPSAYLRSNALGIEFIHVPEGVYDRGGTRTNPKEAEVIADLAFKHLSIHPDKSLGVMTFSISQMNAVKDEIEKRIPQHPDLENLLQEDRLRGFFVKNLENVQGDERDVMIIGVGYGRDRNGAMTMNFGPLNMVGGERRLNVAITRAREKVFLVSSIKSNDIDPSTKSVGVRCLYEYLSYAEQTTKERQRDKEYPHSVIEQQIIEEINRLGYTAVSNIGEGSLKVDIGVKDPEKPERYILGILLDGEGYRATPTARDRDRLREQVLDNMGWNLHRIWSPDFVQRRAAEVERLSQAIREAKTNGLSHRKSNNPKQPKTKRLEPEKVVEMKSDQLPGTETYTKCSLIPSQIYSNIPPNQKSLYLDLYRLELRNLLPKLVKAESPIHVDYAYDRLNKSMGLKPVPPSFHKTYRGVVDEFVTRGRFEKRGSFLWINGVKDVKARNPPEGMEGEARHIEFISPEELEAAILNVVSHSMGLSKTSLIQETCHIFKFRLTEKTTGILESIINGLIENGALTQKEETIFYTTKNGL
jgi:hypothetical protein